MTNKMFNRYLKAVKHITWYQYTWLSPKQQTKLWNQFFQMYKKEG